MPSLQLGVTLIELSLSSSNASEGRGGLRVGDPPPITPPSCTSSLRSRPPLCISVEKKKKKGCSCKDGEDQFLHTFLGSNFSRGEVIVQSYIATGLSIFLSFGLLWYKLHFGFVHL